MARQHTKKVDRRFCKTKTVAISMIRSDANKTRTQLIKNLKDMGITIPSSLSLNILRDLVARNTCSTGLLPSDDDTSTMTAEQLPGSFSLFDTESDGNIHHNQTTTTSQHRFKVALRTYTLFDCPDVG